MKKYFLLAIGFIAFTSCASFTYERPSYLDASIDFSPISNYGYYVNNTNYCPYPYITKEQVMVVFRGGKLPKDSINKDSYVFTDIAKQCLFDDTYTIKLNLNKWDDNLTDMMTKKDIKNKTIDVTPTLTDALIYIRKKIESSGADGIIDLHFENLNPLNPTLNNAAFKDYIGNKFIVYGTIIKYLE